MENPLHSIDAVVQRTGLSAHVIRIWEKRYRAVEPARTATNRRQYSDEEIERLTLLRVLTRAGQSIGYVAKLPTDQLRTLAAGARAAAGYTRTESGAASADSSSLLLDRALRAVHSMDAGSLHSVLKQAAVTLGTQGMLHRVAAPLAQRLGDLWRSGDITAAHEHFATAVLRSHLAQTSPMFAPSGREPVLIVTTPTAQLHEIGAMLVSAVAANLGWRVIYLGASLPAAEITGAALEHRARAVALSIVFPDDDPLLEQELMNLRGSLPPEVSVIVGGRAAAAYRSALERIGAFQVSDLSTFANLLDQLRRPDPAPNEKPPHSTTGRM
jgi:methanogenic corrinoid protein MtbC1